MSKRSKVMVIASGGGHWTQMLRLRKAFEGHDVFYVGVKEMYRQDVAPARFYAVRDVSRLHKTALLATVSKLLWILLRERPAAIVTTGSAPGMLALRMGRLLGARTAWIDSIANVEEVSLSGRKAGAVADLWLTQWEHLQRPGGPSYRGSVL
jgi:UDP-N-acetylglucosamine:LPS N-acetylglucosamine transferase